MGCGGNSNNNRYQKSCQRYYNNNAQAISAGSSTTLTIAGNPVVNTGISIDTQPQSFNVVRPGLYRISGDVTVSASAAGDLVLEVYKDGVLLPCTVKTFSVLAVGNVTAHTETDILIESCCCNVNHSFTFVINSASTAAGNVASFCAGILKLA